VCREDERAMFSHRKKDDEVETRDDEAMVRQAGMRVCESREEGVKSGRKMPEKVPGKSGDSEVGEEKVKIFDNLGERMERARGVKTVKKSPILYVSPHRVPGEVGTQKIQ